LQDSQDEYQKLPFLTYDNVLTWYALKDLSWLLDRLGDRAGSIAALQQASDLHRAIMAHMVVSDVPGATGPIFASATDGSHYVETDIPPGSLLKLPILGFIDENDPLFARTYAWLHSPNYKYSNTGRRYGLPGSYRVDFTTSWTVADELLLKHGHDHALGILLASPWDGGIISEGINPDTAQMDMAGRAFATAAGYVAHAICVMSCQSKAH
jgi:uncharacterized protein